ncbi:DUF4864 domain-containing protein [Leptothoe kymatousa TAU-MAC 1615]|uniref:DUF4864 domain-containing protein n=1 Tax=Leptothoe kymatousa TAU-MAC 1615 TaxID=2364775 RepID=A0ABS5XYB0_9CYAN|nr:DUF4864 domain-containing protein [Leptothoe kymatousa TAU-MAC 1615]
MSTHDKHAIRSIVERQLQAFQDNDATTAFSLASPELQRQLRQPHAFMEMVRTHYQPVYSPRAVIFEGIVHIQKRPTLQMMVMTKGGTLVRALYMMQQQADSTWRIAGCQLLPVCIENRRRP